MRYQLQVTFKNGIREYHTEKLNTRLTNRVLNKGMKLTSVKYDNKLNRFNLTVKTVKKLTDTEVKQAFASLDTGMKGMHKYKSLTFSEVK